MQSVVKFAAALAVAAVAAASAHAAPLEAYGRLPAIEDAAISPDGGKLGLIVTDGAVRKIAVRDIATGRTEVLDGQGVKLRNVRWADNQHLLIQASAPSGDTNLVFNPTEIWLGFDYNTATRTMRQLLKDNDYSALFGEPALRTVEGKTTLFLENPMGGASRPRIGLWRVGLDLGFTRPFKEGFPDTVQWLVGPDGQPVAETEYNSLSRTWTLKVLRDGAWATAIERSEPIDLPTPIGLGADGASVILRQVVDGQPQFSQVSVATGEARALPVNGLDVRPVLEPQSDVLIRFVSRDGEALRYDMLSQRDQAIWRAAASAYPGDEVRVESWSASHRQLVVLVTSPTTGPAYALVDFDAKTSKWIGDLYPDLKSADLSPSRPFSFRTRGGLTLGGYVTRPAAANGAAVILLHDGPSERFRPGFNWLVQGMASRGYTVVQLNQRGSAAAGSDLFRAGQGGGWSRLGQDIADGVAALAAEG